MSKTTNSAQQDIRYIIVMTASLTFLAFVFMIAFTFSHGMDPSDPNSEMFNGGPGTAMLLGPPLLILATGSLLVFRKRRATTKKD